MRERDHNNLEYEGGPGERLTMQVTAQGTTTHLVTYKLDNNPTVVLNQGDPIELNLNNTSGQRTDLQVITDGTTQGSYEIVIENVLNCVKDLHQIGKCVRTRRVPPKRISLFAFFVA